MLIEPHEFKIENKGGPFEHWALDRTLMPVFCSSVRKVTYMGQLGHGSGREEKRIDSL